MCFFPPWHEFKNSVAVKIRALHLQPFTKNHFHFLILLEKAAFHALIQRAKQMSCRMLLLVQVLPPSEKWNA
jgi:hypothetical protein